MFHLPLLNKLFDGSRNVFDGNLVINAMLVEQVDDISFESLQRSLCDLLDMLWTTVQPSLFPVLNVESKLRRDRNILSKWCECFSDQFLIRERAVNLRCIEESDAALHGGTNERDALLPLHGRPVSKAQSHAAESDGGHFQIAFSNFALLHKTSPSICFVLQTGTHYDTAFAR